MEMRFYASRVPRRSPARYAKPYAPARILGKECPYLFGRLDVLFVDRRQHRGHEIDALNDDRRGKIFLAALAGSPNWAFKDVFYPMVYS